MSGGPVFDVNAVHAARAVRRLAVPVEITCGDCGVVCRDASGAVRMTRDRAERVGCCDECKLIGTAEHIASHGRERETGRDEG